MPENAQEQLEQLNQKIKELVGIYRDAMTDSGHSENEFWIWYTLIVLGGDHAQQDICGMWSLTKQTVHNIVSRMIQDGFVVLEIAPGTRNRKIIRLTEAGREYGNRLLAPICTAEIHAFERLSVTERMAFIRIMGQYISYFKDELTANPSAFPA